mgnify:CR=1 FL=1
MDERDQASCVSLAYGGEPTPANPYPAPDARLEDRPGYPWKVPSAQLMHILHPLACEHPDMRTCGRCLPVEA